MAAQKKQPLQAKNGRIYRSEARTRPEVPEAQVQLGRHIRALREKAGLTQEAAASAAHLDAKHWQELEAGRVNPTLATLLAVARAFEVKLSELFNGV